MRRRFYAGVYGEGEKADTASGRAEEIGLMKWESGLTWSLWWR